MSTNEIYAAFDEILSMEASGAYDAANERLDRVYSHKNLIQ